MATTVGFGQDLIMRCSTISLITFEAVQRANPLRGAKSVGVLPDHANSTVVQTKIRKANIQEFAGVADTNPHLASVFVGISK